MITIIEKLFGSTIGRILAEIAFAGLLLGAFILHYEHKGATSELTKLQVSSAALLHEAQTKIEGDARDYQAAQAANEEKTNEALQTSAQLNQSLADSVRQYDAYRRQHPTVQSPPSPGVAAQPGECGPEDCGAVIDRLAVHGNELAGSVGQLGADLQSCQRDRDALTGQ